jgi:hypothetical protein
VLVLGAVACSANAEGKIGGTVRALTHRSFDAPWE